MLNFDGSIFSAVFKNPGVAIHSAFIEVQSIGVRCGVVLSGLSQFKRHSHGFD